MIQQLKHQLAGAVSQASGIPAEALQKLIEKPKNPEHGDLAIPCFSLAKEWKKSPVDCAKALLGSLELPEGFSAAKAIGPFVNVRFDRSAFSAQVINTVLATAGPLLASSHAPEKILLEYSSPNIAKPFHVGHLRTTLIGNSLARVFRFAGHEVITINHLGDWGTQFGFVWAGCELWGKPENPTVSALVELYRKATSLKDRQEKNELEPGDENLPDVNLIARQYFLDLEAHEETAEKFWQWCLDISLTYLKDTYKRLGISFDHYIGESFYSNMLDDVQQELQAASLLKESQGALGVDLGDELGFARISTPDGRSLYLTRDIASAEYRAKTFGFDKALYVVGAPQTLHFQQLVAVLNALGKEYADKIIHVPFGHVLGMKTRGEGGAIELNEFFDEAYERALNAYHEQVSKRPQGLDEEAVARGVALSAVIFSNLVRTRMKDVHFSWDHALAFQGDSGPYLQYACARINGIKDKAAESGIRLADKVAKENLNDDACFALAYALAEFDEALQRTMNDCEPAHLASYALELAKEFSRAYNALKVVGAEPKLASARLSLFEATRITLAAAIELLGITPLDRM
ncbi:MAG: arginine--tRNA ligase [Bdellovibrionales bacterium]|nr:arginine--tRNA ligase [Bdellovibrionales bacterium]